MTVLLKQAKDMFIIFFGVAGLMLVLFPLIIMIVLKKGAQQSWHGFVVKIKTMTCKHFSHAASQMEQTN